MANIRFGLFYQTWHVSESLVGRRPTLAAFVTLLMSSHHARRPEVSTFLKLGICGPKLHHFLIDLMYPLFSKKLNSGITLNVIKIDANLHCMRLHLEALRSNWGNVERLDFNLLDSMLLKHAFKLSVDHCKLTEKNLFFIVRKLSYFFGAITLISPRER